MPRIRSNITCNIYIIYIYNIHTWDSYWYGSKPWAPLVNFKMRQMSHPQIFRAAGSAQGTSCARHGLSRTGMLRPVHRNHWQRLRWHLHVQGEELGSHHPYSSASLLHWAAKKGMICTGNHAFNHEICTGFQWIVAFIQIWDSWNQWT